MRITPGSTSVRLPVHVFGADGTPGEISLAGVVGAQVERWSGGNRIDSESLTLALVSDGTWAEGNIEHVGGGLHWVSVPDSAVTAGADSVVVSIDSLDETMVGVEVALDAAVSTRATPSDVTDARDEVKARGDAAWTTATGFSTHSAADAAAAARSELATELGRIDASVSSRLSATAVPTNFDSLAISGGGAVTVGTNNDKIGYSIQGAITTLDGLNNLSVSDVDARLAAYDGPTKAEMDAAFAAIEGHGDANWATASGFATPANVTSAQDAVIAQGDSAWVSDWTSAERAQIRYRIGVDGTAAAPSSNSPNLGTLAVNVTRLNGVEIFETTAGRIAGNFSTFFDNADVATAKTLDDVDAKDWTATERNQLRHRLGIDGTTAAPASNSPSLGTVGASVTQVLGTALTETTAGRLAGNLSTFWGNSDAATAKTVDDVGGSGSGTTDWTSSERAQIRHRLGLDGTGAEPTASPSLGTVNANVVQVAGSAVTGVADFRADVSGLSTFNPAADTVTANVEQVLGTAVTETTAGRIAGNLSTFWNNADAATTQTVDDIGSGGAGTADWTDAEREQIRHRLGVDGTTAAPATNSPALGMLAANVVQVGGTEVTGPDDLKGDGGSGLTAQDVRDALALAPTDGLAVASGSVDAFIGDQLSATGVQQLRYRLGIDGDKATPVDDGPQLGTLSVVVAYSVSTAVGANSPGEIDRIAGTTWTIRLEGFRDLSDVERLYFTARKTQTDPDSASLLQIRWTKGGDPGDGLIYANAAAAPSNTHAELVADELADGVITLIVRASVTAEMTPDIYAWDVKSIDDLAVSVSSGSIDDVQQEAKGTLSVEGGITRATS